MNTIGKYFVTCLAILGSSFAYATLVIPVHLTDADGSEKKIGTVKADDTIYGVVFTPKLHDLPPGIHGFHIHAMASCNHDGMAAGGHYDPDKSNAHKGPYEGGHLGDLPVLIVDAEGNATLPVLAPRLKLATIKNRALMIHAGGDNYSDTPAQLGVGGARIACGLHTIPE
jgi:Cu-Zn family superoxide dismutase